MLFTPKRYGKSYRLFLALSFFGAALVAAMFAVADAVGWMAFDDSLSRPLFALAMIAVAFAFGALSFGQWQWFRRTPAD